MQLLLAGLVVLLLQPPAAPLAKASPPAVQSNPLLSNAQSGSGLLFTNSARAKRQEAAFSESKAAQKLARDGQTREAVAKYETLVADPELVGGMGYTNSLEGLGDIYGQQGRTREAIELYRTLVYVKPGQMWLTSRSNAPDLRMKFALLLHQAGLYDEALANYNEGAKGIAGYTHTMDGRLPMDPAIFAVNTQTVPTTRFTFAAHMALAACRSHFNKVECMAHLREAAKLRPSQAQPHYYIGRMLLWDEEGKGIVPAPPEAVAELEQAIALDTSPSHDTRPVATFWLENFRNAAESRRRHAAQTAKTPATETPASGISAPVSP